MFLTLSALIELSSIIAKSTSGFFAAAALTEAMKLKPGATMMLQFRPTRLSMALA